MQRWLWRVQSPQFLPLVTAFPFCDENLENVNIAWRSLVGKKYLLVKYYDSDDVTAFWVKLNTDENALGEKTF